MRLYTTRGLRPTHFVEHPKFRPVVFGVIVLLLATLCTPIWGSYTMGLVPFAYVAGLYGAAFGSLTAMTGFVVGLVLAMIFDFSWKSMALPLTLIAGGIYTIIVSQIFLGAVKLYLAIAALF